MHCLMLSCIVGHYFVIYHDLLHCNNVVLCRIESRLNVTAYADVLLLLLPLLLLLVLFLLLMLSLLRLCRLIATSLQFKSIIDMICFTVRL